MTRVIEMERIIQKTIEKEMQELKERMKDCYYSKSGLNEAEKYIKGLLSRAERKNGWQMSEILGESTPYKIQQFINRGRWSADELRDVLQKYVKEKFGNKSAVLVVDETGFLKQGKMSAGVQRQYSGTAGRIENCQIGVFMNYAADDKFCCIDRGLYIPKQWTEDRERCRKAGIPNEYQFMTKTQMALEMIKRAYEKGISFEWVSGDSVYGADSKIQKYLEEKDKKYMFAVSGKEYVWIGFEQYSVKEIKENLDEDKWVKISTGTGTKGEKVFEWQYTEVNCGMKNHKKYLIFRRNLSEKNKIRGYIAYGTNETKIEEFVKTAGIRWTIEMNFAEMKGETGLDQYEVRSYEGWQKHITLSCIAHAFLTVLREQFCNLPEMTVEHENTMEEFKKKRKSESLSAKQKSDIL